MRVSRTSPVPLHHQLRSILERQIQQGKWAPHAMIPTEKELSDLYGLSRPTVRQAIAALVADGYLYRQKGRGTFVAPPKIAQPLDTLVGFIEVLQLQGRQPEIQVLGSRTEPASSDVASALQRTEGEAVLVVERRVAVGGEPLLWDHSYLPTTLAADLNDEQLRARPIFHLIEEAGYRLAEACHTIAARPATSEEAVVLELAPDSPVLVIRRVVCDAEGHPIDYSRAIYRSDRYEFQYRLQRKDR